MPDRVLLVGAAGGPHTPGLLTELAASSESVIAVDGGADTCLKWGVSPTAVVGDMDSVKESTLAALQARGNALVRFAPDKDETDLELALAYARQIGAEEIVCTGVLGDRIDHTLAALGAMVRAEATVVSVVEDDQLGWFVTAGETLELQGAGAVVSVLALGGAATVTLEGVRWPLDHHRLLPLSALGVSNVVGSESAHVSVHEGRAVVLAPTVDGAKPRVVASRHSRGE